MNPATLRPVPGVFYRTATGNEPVRDYLVSLSEEERRSIGMDIKVAQYGWPLGLPLVDHLGAGLGEIRTRLPSRIVRTLFFLHEGEFVLLHCYIKKTRATPVQELKLAITRKREIQKNQSPPRK